MIHPIASSVTSIVSQNPLTLVQRPHGGASGGTAAPGQAAGGSFATELAGAMAEVENSARASGDLRDRMLRGENVELHTVAIQSQHAQASFELFLQVRNKLIQGYQEIMRMQI